MAVSTRFVVAALQALPDLPAALPDDVILAARMAEIAARLNAAGIPYDVTALKTDTVAIIQRVSAFREGLVRGAITDAEKAVLVAYSWGAYLDHLGATQTPGVVRKALVADPRPYVYGTDSAADWEEDDDFRGRIMLAPETLSAAGPEGAYYALAIAVEGVGAAAAYGPMSFGGTPDAPFTPLGEVRVPVVAAPGYRAGDGDTANDGVADAALVAAVQAQFRPDDRRPLADFVTASAATLVPYAIEVVLTVASGVAADLVQAAAEAQLSDLAADLRQPGRAAKRLLIAGRAGVTGTDGRALVSDVDLISPAADVNPGPISPANPGPAYRAPHCTGITVRVEVRDD